MRPPGARVRLALAAASLALLAALAVSAAAPAAAVPRTLVVRGHVLSPEGAPVAGARVLVRGSASVSALTDERGRYSLSVPLGMPAALKRLPFRIEVRAEDGGRRLPLAAGGASLVIEADWPDASEGPRVRSNQDAAATAVATALGVEGMNLAWVEADFGATPAPATGRPAGPIATPRDSVPAAAPPKRPTRAVRPRAVDAPRETVRATPPRTRVPAAPPAPGRAAAGDTTARVVASARSVEAPPPRTSAVRAVDPYAARDSAPAADSCRCSLRGTVEIRWDRPLEDHSTVRVELDAPGAKPEEVSLFMGAPREFRFGPLPCGDWKLTVRSPGRLRFADASGDTARIVSCAGATETRIVLVPVKR